MKSLYSALVVVVLISVTAFADPSSSQDVVAAKAHDGVYLSSLHWGWIQLPSGFSSEEPLSRQLMYSIGAHREPKIYTCSLTSVEKNGTKKKNPPALKFAKNSRLQIQPPILVKDLTTTGHEVVLLKYGANKFFEIDCYGEYPTAKHTVDLTVHETKSILGEGSEVFMDTTVESDSTQPSAESAK